MKKRFTVFCLMLIFLAACNTAFAAKVTVNAVAVSAGSETVVLGIGGRVSEVCVNVGDRVQAGDALARLEANKVYALEDGVARLFGEPGDSAQSVSEKYGAVAYVEPAIRYSIASSTKYAYTNEANKVIHPGESVYLRSSSNMQHVGVGRVTTVSGTSYTVEVLEGNFASGETVGIYREPNYAVTSRIGLDAVSLNAPAAYTAEGVIASYKVNDGDSVKKGDVLFETFEGVYSGSEAPTGAVVSPVDGVVASVELSQGTDAAPGSAAFTVYPDSAMRLEAQVAESELKFFAVGGKVTVEPAYADGDEAISGAIERISLLGSETDESGEAYYSVFIIPEDAASLYYGMHVVISLQ